MRRYGLFLTFALLVMLAWGYIAVAHGQMFSQRQTDFDASAAKSLTVRGMCDNWKAWRKGWDLIVTCPGGERPVGAVELRAYYVVGG